MIFTVHDKLSEDTLKKGLSAVIRDGIASQIKMTLTESLFLIAFALALGASNAVIGLLAAIPPLTQFLQIPSILLVERTQVRRGICVMASIASRLSILLMALIPFLASGETGLILLLVGVTSHALFGAISATAWNSWMRDLVPEATLGTFFAKRLAIQALVGIFATLATGLFIDRWLVAEPGSLTPYSLVFLAGLAAGLIGVYFIYTIPEPKMVHEVNHSSLLDTLRRPFRDDAFRKLMLFSWSWSFAITLVAPFFTVYLLSGQYLGYSMYLVTALSVLTQTTSMLFYQWWGKLSDRFSNKTVLRVTTPVYVAGIVLWTFTTLPDPHVLTIPLLIIIHMMLGLAAAAVNLAHGNLALKLAPKTDSTAYLASWSIVNSIAAILAPLVGGLTADVLADSSLTFLIDWTGLGFDFSPILWDIKGLDFVFMLSFAVGVYSIHRLALVKEVGEVDEKVVIDAMVAQAGRGLRTISTIEGLRYSLLTPVWRAWRASHRHRPAGTTGTGEDFSDD